MAKLSSSNHLLEISPQTKWRVSQIGGKGHNLQELQRRGYQTPETYVLSTEMFPRVDRRKIDRILSRLDFANAVYSSQKMTELLKDNFKKDDIKSVLQEKLPLAAGEWATRSSANLEDGSANSFAGLFNSVLSVNTIEKLLSGIWQVYQSAYSPRVLMYCLAKKIDPRELSMAVLLQKMITPHYAGTAFTKDMETGDSSTIYIEVTNGLGEGVVDGTVSATKYKVAKNENNCRQEGDISLPEKLLTNLKKQTTRIETELKSPQDIEWAYDDNGLWILQTRPITA